MQSVAGARGAEMDPSSTRVGKHSRSCAVSVAERDHVYSRHASPRRHVCRCEEFEAENAAHSPRSGCRRLPQEWHCSPGTPVSCTWPQQGVTRVTRTLFTLGELTLGDPDYTGPHFDIDKIAKDVNDKASFV